jgi:hypothetical protein
VADTVIVGGGFSAFLANAFIDEDIININGSLPKTSDEKKFIRRPQLEVNKLFIKKGYSHSKLIPNLKNLALHDRVINGGNSNIWGGVIDCHNMPKKIIKVFKDHKIILQPLSFQTTGTISNNTNIFQLQDISGGILDISEYTKTNDKFLESIAIEGNRVKLEIISTKNTNKSHTIYAKKLILCTGFFQTIDLLYRSKLIGEGDEVSFTEFNHQRSLKFTFSPSHFLENNSTIVRFNSFRAVCHYLGIQKKLWVVNLFNCLPFFIDQKFIGLNFKYRLKIKDGQLDEISDETINSNKILPPYGSSIHYCNLKINGRDLNTFLAKKSEAILGIGMAFTKQTKPGPISNDIALDAHKKLSDYHT